jgi:hypothetical protein
LPNEYIKEGKNRMENPPLWVWAIIVGVIIAGKFIYRWQATKQFAKEDKIKSDDKIKDSSNGFNDDTKNSNNFTNSRYHKYSPKFYYKDYFAVKRKRK